ncbi:hypothetical protein [Mesorhizobium sp. ORM16]|uniref:hypothetical protein n=1 Tax=Mesorhizobium sp. ORM16 TaxID=3376989 RepID=UPI003857AD6D
MADSVFSRVKPDAAVHGSNIEFDHDFGNEEPICSQSQGTVTDIYHDHCNIDEIVGSSGTVEDTNYDGSIDSVEGMQACLATSISLLICRSLSQKGIVAPARVATRLKPRRASNHCCCVGLCRPCATLGDHASMKRISLLLLSAFGARLESLKKRVVRSGTDPRAGGLFEPVPDRTVSGNAGYVVGFCGNRVAKSWRECGADSPIPTRALQT